MNKLPEDRSASFDCRELRGKDRGQLHFLRNPDMSHLDGSLQFWSTPSTSLPKKKEANITIYILSWGFRGPKDVPTHVIHGQSDILWRPRQCHVTLCATWNSHRHIDRGLMAPNSTFLFYALKNFSGKI